MSATKVAGDTPFELDAMARAVRYQRWVIDTVAPHLGNHILEVGSGIGTMTRWLAERAPTIATDIDARLLSRLELAAPTWTTPPEAVLEFDIIGFAQAPPVMASVDTVISFNVLEHIEDDEAAVCGMWRVLNQCGPADRPRRLIIFVPAHQWAHGSIDLTFGHFRRYKRERLADLIARTAPSTARIHARYFNTFGLPGWYLMGKVFKKPTFGARSVGSMERLIPMFSRIDPLLHGRHDLPFGQSVLAVAEIPPRRRQ